MISRLMTIGLVAAVASSVMAMAAMAESDHDIRFTVTNNTDAKVRVTVYNGDDWSCKGERDTEYVTPSKTKTFSCNGNGMNVCRVTTQNAGEPEVNCVSRKNGTELICKQHNSGSYCTAKFKK
ncbi:MAG: hypothetical protein ABJH52_00710 [Henriciella sp.]